jgi:hypothetical protein
MNTDPIRYVAIWSGWLRVAHWTIAAGAMSGVLSQPGLPCIE